MLDPLGLMAETNPFGRLKMALEGSPLFLLAPRGLQETSWSFPRGIPDGSRRPRCSKMAPGWLQDASRAHLGAILGPLWTHFDTMLRPCPPHPQCPLRALHEHPKCLQEQAMKPLEPILKMPQRPQELRCCKELLVSKVPCSSAWVGGTRERGYNN